MARKLLIIIALIIAAFPYLGFTRSMDITVTTVLALFMAAVLLFSKRPKMVPLQNVDPYPQAKPSPFVPSMHDLPITHPKEEAFTSVLRSKSPDVYNPPAVSIPSPVQTPLRKRTRMVQPVMPTIENIPSIVKNELGTMNTTTATRRPRKLASSVTLSEEVQVQPADTPFRTSINSFDHPSTEVRS